MAVTPTTIVELNELAKDFYSEVYVDATNPEVPLKAQFEKLERAMFTGRKWIFATKLAIGGGSANAGANKTLPGASEGQYDQGEMNVVRTYTRLALDNLLIEVTRKRDGSYRPALSETMEDRLAAHDLEVNRQLHGFGTGVVADIAGAFAGDDVVVENDYGVADGGKGSRHVNVGDMFAVYDSTLTTLRGRFTAEDVDYDTDTITADAPVAGTVAGDKIARATSDDTNVATGEVQGLGASVKASGTHMTIPVGGRWKAIVKDNGGVARELTDTLLLQTIEEQRAKSRKYPNLAVTRSGVVLKYDEQFLALRQIMGQDVELKGGFKPTSAITHKGSPIPVLEDVDTPDGRLYLLNTDAFRLADLVGTEWFDGDGAQFTRVTDKDSIEGFIRKYWALATVQMNSLAVIKDLEDVAAIDRV